MLKEVAITGRLALAVGVGDKCLPRNSPRYGMKLIQFMGVIIAWTMASSAMAEVPVLPDAAVGWSQAARNDIAAAYDTLVVNHPGMYDPANPDFPKQLDLAKAESLKLADQVSSASGYTASLERFSAILGDGHAQILASPEVLKATQKARWPGFVGVWRREALYVYRSEFGGPPSGAEIVSCDGVGIRDLIRRNVFTFRGREKETGLWWVHSPEVFIDEGNPFITKPQTCAFRHAGREMTQALRWRNTNYNYHSWLEASYNGDILPVGLSEPHRGLMWVAMPSFEPGEAQRTAYRKMFATLDAERPRFVGARAVVLDLRNNQGGSNEWGGEVARRLWGTATIDHAMLTYLAGMKVWWRASADNAAHLGGLISLLRAEQRDAVADEVAPIAEGLKSASDRGDIWYVEQNHAPTITGDDERVPFTTPVYVIVPGQCASACLDMLDIVTRFPNVKLVGAPSSADSTYLEIRIATLPSGLAKVVIPNKVYVGRPRKSGEIYQPAIINSDLDWSTDSFIALIEADLKGK